VTYRHTVSQTHTDHATSVTIGRILMLGMRCGLTIAVNLTCIGLPRFIEIHSRWRLKVDRVRLIFLRLSGRECGPE